MKKKKRIMYISLFFLIIASLGIYSLVKTNTIDENNLEKFEAIGVIPVDKSFIGFADAIINLKGQFFTFVNVRSTQTTYFMKTTDAQYVYHYTPGQSVVTGSKCKVGEVIRFKFCTQTNNKGSCFTDMFDELWQVHKTGDYPNLKDFYVNDMDFYYSYTCYEPFEMFADTFERRFLYNNKCVSADESGGKGIDYDFEKNCLDALNQIQEEQRIAQEKAEAQRQEELRLENLKKQCTSQGGSFSTSTEKCTLPKTPTTPTTPTDDTTDETGTPTDNTQTNTTTDLSNDDTNTQTTETKLTCEPYQLVKDNDCKFALSKFVTNKGLVGFWEDFKTESIIAIFVLVLLILAMPIKKGGKKK